MADLPDFNIGETLRGFPGARMRQLVEAVRESLAESDLAGSQAQAKAQSMLRRFQVRALVENGHASALEPFGVLGFSDLGSAVASLDDALAASHQMILEGATPATAHADRMLIVQDGADAGDSVPACVMGLTLVQVDVTSTSHTKASLINGDATKLASGDSGPATIWWTATGSTGVQWCLVLIGGGGGGSGSAINRAFVFQDFPGYEYDAEPRATIPTVSILRATRDGSAAYVAPTATVEQAEVDFSADLQLNASSCCGGDAASASTGVTVTYPSNGDQRIDGTNGPDGDEGTLLVSGAAARTTSTLRAHLVLPGPVNLYEDATINADGTWNVTFDLTGHATAATGVAILRLTEELIGTPVETLPVVYVLLTWAKGYSAPAMADVDDTPTLAPILNSASNTGDPDDLVTSDRFPVFTIGSTRTATASGPGWNLYANGVLVGTSGAPNDSTFTALRAQAQVASSLSDGRYRITYTLTTDYGSGAVVESGHSPPMDIVIDGDAANSTAAIWGQRAATADFDTGDATIALSGTFTLKNETEDADPAAPSSVAQPTQRIVGQAGDILNMQYTEGAWQVVSRDLGVRRYCRECFLSTVDGVLTIINVSPCPREITPQEAVILDRPES